MKKVNKQFAEKMSEWMVDRGYDSNDLHNFLALFGSDPQEYSFFKLKDDLQESLKSLSDLWGQSGNSGLNLRFSRLVYENISDSKKKEIFSLSNQIMDQIKKVYSSLSNLDKVMSR